MQLRFCERHIHRENYQKRINELLKPPGKIENKYYRINFNKALIEELELKESKIVIPSFYYTDYKGNKSFFYYKQSVNWTHFVTNILDRFLSLPQPEREKIYCVEQYKEIKDSLDNSTKIIKVSLKGTANDINSNTSDDTDNNKRTKIFYVKPYKLEVDDNSNSYYLIGYSKDFYSIEDKYYLQCFKLIRIESCEQVIGTYGGLTEKEKKDADERIDKYGPAFIIGKSNKKKDDEEFIIRLTAKGYTDTYLRKKSHNRPILIEEPKQTDDKLYYYLKFDCSLRQLELYFEQFGEDATVIKPETLAKDFNKFFQKASQNSGKRMEKNKDEVTP